MKRRFSFPALATLFCLSVALLTVPAVAAEAVPNASAMPKMVVTTPNGTPHAWQPGGFYFKPGADCVFIDYFSYELSHPLHTVGVTSCIALSDLKTIYAPDFQISEETGKITLSHAGVSAVIAIGSTELNYYGGTAVMTVAPFWLDGEIYVPIQDVLCIGFGKSWSELNGFFAVGNTEDFKVTSADVYNLRMFYRGKNVGKSYWTFWNEEIGKLEPYVIYIPSTYNADETSKAIVQLCGAGSNCRSIPDGEEGVKMMRYAEEYGYIVVWPDPYVKQGNWGNWVPPCGMVPVTAETVFENPGNYSEGKLADIQLSGNNVVHTLDQVKSKWSIDDDNVFCMGISMGGCGTWYQAAFNSEHFAAFSPSGAFVEKEFFPWEKVKKPVLYVGGTEDRNGYDLMVEAYDYALAKGANIKEFITVGGAPHGGEWPEVLDKTFQFFESHLSQTD